VDTALVVALISGAVAIFSAIMSRQAQLAVERRKEATTAKEVLEQYRGPLLDAAWLLGDRIDNIRHRSFLGFLAGDRAQVARLTTLFRFASFFGWRELLRLRVQLLRFEKAEDTRLVADFLGTAALVLVTDDLDDHRRGMLWADEQRGIGELMMEEDRTAVFGHATFRRDYDEVFAHWMDRFGDDVLTPEAKTGERLKLLQWALYGLVRLLDRERVYPTRWLDRSRDEIAEPPGSLDVDAPEAILRDYLGKLPRDGPGGASGAGSRA
jgi:hypothetical protein